jgi:hypothetical protein
MVRWKASAGRQRGRQAGRPKTPHPLTLRRTGRPEGRPKTPRGEPSVKMKNYPKNKKNIKKKFFLHYKKGKYYLIDLNLKKRGHQQK